MKGAWRMMRKRLLPSLILLLCLPVLLRLGFWQLERAAWKDALLARIDANRQLPVEDLPDRFGAAWDWRRVRAVCTLDSVPWRRVRGGESATGESGFVYEVRCRNLPLSLVAGWSARHTQPPPGSGRLIVAGLLYDRSGGGGPALIGRPDVARDWVLHADAPLAGLAPAVAPSAARIANNHRSYAVQWFSFAAILCVVYALALRRRA